MGALADLLAAGAADFGDAVGDHAQSGATAALVPGLARTAHVAMPAGLRDRVAGEQNPRPVYQAFVHGAGEPEIRAAAIAHRGEPAV